MKTQRLAQLRFDVEHHTNLGDLGRADAAQTAIEKLEGGKQVDAVPDVELNISFAQDSGNRILMPIGGQVVCELDPAPTAQAYAELFASAPQLKEEGRNLAEATAVIAFWVGSEKKKLGKEGLIMNYDLTVQIAEAFCKKFPAGYDWEAHMDKNGDCWDVECECFSKQYIKDHDIYVTEDY